MRPKDERPKNTELLQQAFVTSCGAEFVNKFERFVGCSGCLLVAMLLLDLLTFLKFLLVLSLDLKFGVDTETTQVTG